MNYPTNSRKSISVKYRCSL